MNDNSPEGLLPIGLSKYLYWYAGEYQLAFVEIYKNNCIWKLNTIRGNVGSSAMVKYCFAVDDSEKIPADILTETETS